MDKGSIRLLLGVTMSEDDQRLFEKLEIQREALGGRVFDVANPDRGMTFAEAVIGAEIANYRITEVRVQVGESFRKFDLLPVDDHRAGDRL